MENKNLFLYCSESDYSTSEVLKLEYFTGKELRLALSDQIFWKLYKSYLMFFCTLYIFRTLKVTMCEIMGW